MPLTRLELYNFKSYKGTKIIDFGDAPFTCIIGPNGAGKSNLMDAISFVLGVRSAQLRSTQLKDLVYRGRKVQVEGEESMDGEETQDDNVDARTAWVLIAYEDDKGLEWTFKRIVSTSGQSTYQLNGDNTTSKVYHAKLAEFKILVKAKNFLVFQGDVESVASQDSKELAKLIDRISGSLDMAADYESKKAAQDRATEASNANYAKKRAMTQDAKHYKEQRDEINQWEKMREEKDEMVQHHLLWRLFHLTTQINESTRQVEEANERLTGLRSNADRNDRKLRDAKKEVAQAQLNVKKREGAVKKAEKAVDDKKPELVAIETQIAHSIKKSRNAATMAERVEADEVRLSDSLNVFRQGLEDIQRQKDNAAERQRQKSQASGRVLTGADMDEYRNLRAQANTRAVLERSQAETLRRQLKTERDGLASIEDKVQQAERQRSKLDGEVQRLRDREETMTVKVQDATDERERIKAQLDQAQAERQRINMKETEINERLQDTYNKLLQAGVDKRESEREIKLKEVLQSLKRVFPGVHGRVVDLCKPTASRYSTAVLTVLARNLDSVVVDSEKTAIDCIEYMRNQRAGQATFIPLDTIQVSPVPERLRNFAKGARLAIDCIEYDAAVERAMQHSCGSSLICDTMDLARYISYEKGQEVKAVTLEGTVIHRNGLITGGQGPSGGRKFNDQDVQNLQRLKDQYVQQLQELNRTRPSEKGDEGLLQDLAKLEAEATVAKDDLDATKLRLNGLRAELQHVESDTANLTPDREARRGQVHEAEVKLSGLTATIDAADNAVFDAFCRRIRVTNIREYEDVQINIAKEDSEALEGFSVQLARIGHQIEFETAQLKTTQERVATLRSTVDKEVINVQKLHDTMNAVQIDLEKLQKELERQRVRLTEANEAYQKTNEQSDTLRNTTRDSQRTLDKAMKEISAWNDDIEKSASGRHAIYRRCRLEDIDLPLKSGRLDKVPIEEAADVAMDVDDEGTQRPTEVKDFGIVPDFDVLEDDDKNDGGDEYGRSFETRIAKLNADFERVVPNMKAAGRLGEVEANLEAAEREAESTRKDSKDAKEAFNIIKKNRIEKFNAAYQHMSGCIDKIYKDLTKSTTFPTGGVGFLSLMDADEPYLSGVKYNVMPPGKRFVEMEQLSGGEKTMAALALLFAIHSFHPAPFFVLDEVDAALDPTNVSKLARYVRSQAEKDVQFLIISLKSALYEHADSLIGVYREQDENTSDTLKLDLRKYVE